MSDPASAAARTLCRRPGKERSLRRRMRKGAPKGIGGMGGDIVRVLIVEDDPAFRDLYAWYLHGDSEQRYEPVAVETGAAAIELCRTQPPDCAILDFQLPDTTGLDLLARLVDGSGSVPFATIMVSAHASTELATAALG